MKKRIFLSILAVSASILVVTSALIVFALYKDYEKERKQELASECMYLAEAFGDNGIAYLKSVGRKSPNRITLIDSGGTVLYDSFADA
ncbi:MAG TPA: histidine kinase, partial [Clostridiales bacterium]|nr:histidine kinase [Clostridiales bacterium]